MTQTSGGMTPPPWHKALPRIALRLAVLAGLIWAAHLGFGWGKTYLGTLSAQDQATAKLGFIIAGIVIYALFIAIPFVPAVEIGIALMIMEGPTMAPIVYVATVLGLMLAFLVGQRISMAWIAGIFRDLRMLRVQQLLLRIDATAPDQRLKLLEDRLPRFLAPIATRYRYVTLAVLLNVPGNSIIGGGGGIMIIAALSRFFKTSHVLGMLLIAVAPVPLAVWIFGVGVLG